MLPVSHGILASMKRRFKKVDYDQALDRRCQKREIGQRVPACALGQEMQNLM
jgi:hypothetical protein